MARNEVRIHITGDPSALGAALGQSAGMLQTFQAKAAAIGAKMKDVGRTMTLGVTLPLAAGAYVATKWAGELEDAEAMSVEVFGAMADTMKRWAADGAKAFGLSAGDATEWASQMGIRLRNIGGLSQEQAARVSQNLVQLAGDLKSAFGGSVDEAAQALASGLTGEFEPLKRYGVVINDLALKNKLFEMTGEKVKGTLTAQQKQLATLALITEQTGIVQGDFARNAEGATNSQAIMTAELKNAAVTIGTTLLPYATRLAQWVADMAEKFSNLSPGIQQVIVILGGLAAVAGPLIWIIGGLATVIGAVSAPVLLVGAAIGALVAAFIYFYRTNEGFREWVNGAVAALRQGLGVAIDWVRAKLPILTAWFKDKVMPVLRDLGELVRVVARQVADGFSNLIGFVRQHWGTISQVIHNAWAQIQGMVSGALQFIRGVIQLVTGIITGDWSKAWQGIRNIVGGAWNFIISIIVGAGRNIWVAISGIGRTIINGISSAWNWAVAATSNGVASVVSFAMGLPGRIRGIFSGAAGWLVNAGRSIMDGLLSGIRAAWDRVADFVGGIGNRIRALKGPLPEDRRMLVPEGEAIMEGLGRGIQTGWGRVGKMVSGINTDLRADIGVSQSAGGMSVAPANQSGDIHVHFHGPVAKDAESWLLDVLAKANRRGMAAIPGVA